MHSTLCLGLCLLVPYLLLVACVAAQRQQRQSSWTNVFIPQSRIQDASGLHPEITFHSGRPPQYDLRADRLDAIFSRSSPVQTPLVSFPTELGYGPEYFQQLIGPGVPSWKDQCPAKKVKCDPKARYRTIDGTCNNLDSPQWGAPNLPYARLVPNRYADGVHAYPVSITGAPLPAPRALSRLFLPIQHVEDPKWTLLFMQWGQIITHDMSSAKDIAPDIANPTCCGPKGVLKRKSKGELCDPPRIERDDPLFIKYQQRCFDFLRTSTDASDSCRAPAKESRPVSSVTSWMDASLVYGDDEATARSLRQGSGGLLKTAIRGGQEWPPSDSDTSTCLNDKVPVCYKMGDPRANQNPGLAMLQIVLLREHNRLARALSSINKHWDDERLYQEARRILIAEHQHISYYEWLPGLFVDSSRRRRQLGDFEWARSEDGYDSNVNPAVLNEHAQAAFRSLHSTIQGKLQLKNEERYDQGFLLLPEHMLDVSVLEAPDVFDRLARGHSTQRQHAIDKYHDKEVKEDIFRNPISSRVGFDLKTIDVQRDRDHGVGSYSAVRAWCGQRPAHSFADFADSMSSEDAFKLSQVYERPDDVDLTIGGHLENQKSGGLGPTFSCILKEQFRRTRQSDRFFYEFKSSPHPFTPKQLEELKKSSVARLLCDTGRDISFMQPKAFLVISRSNLLVPCDDYSAIPIVDLEAWRERSNGASASAGIGRSHAYSFMHYLR